MVGFSCLLSVCGNTNCCCCWATDSVRAGEEMDEEEKRKRERVWGVGENPPIYEGVTFDYSSYWRILCTILYPVTLTFSVTIHIMTTKTKHKGKKKGYFPDEGQETNIMPLKCYLSLSLIIKLHRMGKNPAVGWKKEEEWGFQQLHIVWVVMCSAVCGQGCSGKKEV